MLRYENPGNFLRWKNARDFCVHPRTVLYCNIQNISLLLGPCVLNSFNKITYAWVDVIKRTVNYMYLWQSSPHTCMQLCVQKYVFPTVHWSSQTSCDRLSKSNAVLSYTGLTKQFNCVRLKWIALRAGMKIHKVSATKLHSKWNPRPQKENVGQYNGREA